MEQLISDLRELSHGITQEGMRNIAEAATEMFCLGMREPAFRLRALLCLSISSDSALDSFDIMLKNIIELFRVAWQPTDHSIFLRITEESMKRNLCTGIQRKGNQAVLYLLCAYSCIQSNQPSAAMRYIDSILTLKDDEDCICEDVFTTISLLYEDRLLGHTIASSLLERCVCRITSRLSTRSQGDYVYPRRRELWRYRFDMGEIHEFRSTSCEESLTCTHVWLCTLLSWLRDHVESLLELEQDLWPRPRYRLYSSGEMVLFGIAMERWLAERSEGEAPHFLLLPSMVARMAEFLMALLSLLIHQSSPSETMPHAAVMCETAHEDVIVEAAKVLRALSSLDSTKSRRLINALQGRFYELFNKAAESNLREEEQQLVMDAIFESYRIRWQDISVHDSEFYSSWGFWFSKGNAEKVKDRAQNVVEAQHHALITMPDINLWHPGQSRRRDEAPEIPC